jgi:proline iminopeptidase
MHKYILSTLLLCTALLSPIFAEKTTTSIEQRASVAQETYVESGSSKLFCRAIGKGAPLLVLHGGPGMNQEYLYQELKQLGANNQVIFYDQRGAGSSEGPIDLDSITLETFVEDIEAIRKAYKLEKISLLGHSWGGHLAMQYAIRYPGRVDKLILMSSTSGTTSDFMIFMQEWAKRMAPYMATLNKIKEGFKAGDTATVTKYFQTMFGPYCFKAEDVAKLALSFSPQANINGNKSYELICTNHLNKPFDLTNDLKKLKCKTLIIHGKEDIIPVVTAKHLQESIPGSALVVLENCGHFPYVEQPEGCFKTLSVFLKN